MKKHKMEEKLAMLRIQPSKYLEHIRLAHKNEIIIEKSGDFTIESYAMKEHEFKIFNIVQNRYMRYFNKFVDLYDK
jgi:hypothetical protein